MPTDSTKNTKFLFGQQITQITQKINFVIFVEVCKKDVVLEFALSGFLLFVQN